MRIDRIDHVQLAMTEGEDDAEIVEYPDSGKLAITSQTKDGSPMTARLRFVGRIENSIDYWDGEK